MRNKMKMSKFLAFAYIFLTSFLTAQTDSLQHEISGNIQELSDFHEVIYKIWHEAYPGKDYKALKSFVPEINLLSDKVYSVQLPGILRDKTAKWNEGLKELKNAVAYYNEAAAKNSNDALLEAAENLHSRFEMMVRIIRPVLKEVDEFHKVLYIVYHKDLPAKQYENIKLKADEFVAKAKAITEAKLSKRLESKQEKFDKASTELLAASIELKNKTAAGKGEDIDSAVNKMHSKYQVLELVFE